MTNYDFGRHSKRIIFRRSIRQGAYDMHMGKTLIGTVTKRGRTWYSELNGDLVATGTSRTYVADRLLARYDEQGGSK